MLPVAEREEQVQRGALVGVVVAGPAQQQVARCVEVVGIRGRGTRPGVGVPVVAELLTRARTLAERLGITVPYTLPGLDEASLDLDV